jgi:hypothetical protein
MKSLLELYNEAAPSSDVGKVRETVATVSREGGDEGVNFFDKEATFQKNFIERGYQDKVVTQSTEDDKTKGNFTNKALLFYADHVSKFKAQPKARPDEILHFYNQRDNKTWYKTRNSGRAGITQTYSI